MNEESPTFYSVIPATVRYNENLCPNAKLLYGEITALCSKEGFCWANNNYFAKLYKVGTNTVSLWITSLQEEGFIRTQTNQAEGNRRRIFLMDSSYEKSLDLSRKKVRGSNDKKGEGLPKNDEHSIIINNILSTTDNSLREIVLKIQKDYPVIFESLISSKGFHERLQLSLKSDKLNSNIEKDIIPVILLWLKNKWVGNDLEKPVTRLRTEAASYVLQVVKNGGLTSAKKEDTAQPTYLRKIL